MMNGLSCPSKKLVVSMATIGIKHKIDWKSLVVALMALEVEAREKEIQTVMPDGLLQPPVVTLNEEFLRKMMKVDPL